MNNLWGIGVAEDLALSKSKQDGLKRGINLPGQITNFHSEKIKREKEIQRESLNKLYFSTNNIINPQPTLSTSHYDLETDSTKN